MAHLAGSNWFIIATTADKLHFYNVNSSTIEKSYNVSSGNMIAADDLGDNVHLVSSDSGLLNVKIRLWDRTLANNNSSTVGTITMLLGSIDRVKRLQDGQHIAVEYGSSSLRIYNAVSSFSLL